MQRATLFRHLLGQAGEISWRLTLAGLAALVAAPAMAKTDQDGRGHRPRHPVLLISIDGLRPADVLEAEQRGMRLPHLRAFLRQGAYASGVTGVQPTLTYPSHTTLITGTAPAEHSVANNTSFDPLAINQDGWYWYASDIARPTLFDAARKAGLSTGNVHWPVSVGARITWNLPQIWRSGHADDAKLLEALATPGLVQELQAREGSYAQGKDEDLPADQNRTRFAARMIAQHRPAFMAVYLASLDHVEHAQGPDSPQAKATLEQIDALVGQLVAAERRAHRHAVIAIVSDHGFAPVDTAFNLSRALIDAGLLRLSPPDPLGRVSIAGWDAAVWAAGGSLGVVLARPEDAALKDKLRGLLQKLQADPENHITALLEGEAIAKAGGTKQASFLLQLAPPMLATGYISSTLPLRFPSPYKGMHGYAPTDARMNATFLIAGGTIPKGRNLGQIDMRAIAPTLARELGVTLPTASAKALKF